MTPSVPVSVLRSRYLEDSVDFILKILREHVAWSLKLEILYMNVKLHEELCGRNQRISFLNVFLFIFRIAKVIMHVIYRNINK